MRMLPPRLAGTWPLLAALVLVPLLYRLGLHGPFIYDDAYNLAPVLSWERDLTPWQDVVLGNHSGPLRRPVSMLSFLITGMLFGVEPFGFKLGNLLLHLTTGVLAWSVLRRVMQLDSQMAPHADILATCAAALWLLHPLHASTVLYAVQRMAQLGAAFSLAVLLAYLQARKLLDSGDRQSGLRRLFLIAPLLLLLGMLSKENAIIAGMLCLLVEMLYPARTRSTARPLRLFLLLTAIIPTILAMVVLLKWPQRILAGYSGRDFSPVERLMTQARVLVDYLGQIFFPNTASMTVYTDGYLPSTGLLSPPSTLLAILGLALITIVAWRLRKRLPIIAFGWGFFLISHAVESTLLGLDLYYDHRNYLPMVGLLGGIVGGSWIALGALHRQGARAKVSAALVLLCSAGLAWGTADRAGVWQSREGLLDEALEHHPESLRAQLARIDADLSIGKFDPVGDRLTKLEQHPSARHRLIARIERLRLQCRMGDTPDPADIAASFTEYPPNFGANEIQSINYLLQGTHSGQCPGFDDRALGAALAKLAEDQAALAGGQGRSAQIHFSSAIAFGRSGHHEPAARQAQIAWDHGGSMEVGFVLTLAQCETGDLSGAERTIGEMEARLPRFSRAAERELYKAQVYLRMKRESKDPGSQQLPPTRL